MTREEVEAIAMQTLLEAGHDPMGLTPRVARHLDIYVKRWGVRLYLDPPRCETFIDLHQWLTNHIETYLQDKIHAQSA